MKKPWKWRVSVMLVALWAGVALTFDTYQKLLIGLLVIAFVPLALILQSRQPVLGFAILMVTAVAVPLEYVGPSERRFNFAFLLSAYLCASWLLAVIVWRSRTVLDSSRLVLAASAFMAVALASFGVGQYPWFPTTGAPQSAQLAGLGLFLLSGGLCLAFGHQVKKLAHLRWITWLFLGAGTLVCLADVVPVLGPLSYWTRPESLGSLFWTWLVAISFSQACLNVSLSPFSRTLLFCLTTLTLYRCLFQAWDWKSGWLPPLVAFGIILFFRLPRLTVGIASLALPAGLFLSAKLWGFLMVSEQYSYMTRLEAWKVLWQIIEKSPLIGLGPANYYYYTLLFPILGWYVSFNSHNNYADLLAQCGFLGLFTFGWFAFELSLMTFRLRSLVPSGFANAYVIGALGGVVGSLVSGMLADWIIPFVYNVGIRGFRSSLLFWVFAGGILALKRMTCNKAEIEFV